MIVAKKKKKKKTCNFFHHSIAFWLNYLRELPFRIVVWTIYTRSIFSLVLLRISWNFRITSRKESMVRSSRSLVLFKIGILKKFAKFTRKHQCWSHFLIFSRKKRLQHRCFPVTYAKLLKTPILQNILGGVGVCLRKCFTL